MYLINCMYVHQNEQASCTFVCVCVGFLVYVLCITAKRYFSWEKVVCPKKGTILGWSRR